MKWGSLKEVGDARH